MPEQGACTIDQLRAHLRANGLHGMATIERIEGSGKTVGGDHLFTMTSGWRSRARRPTGRPRSAAMVPLAAVGKVALGVTIPVLVDATNPDAIMVEWDKV